MSGGIMPSVPGAKRKWQRSMKIYYDTREQKPLTFKKDKGIEVKKKTLAVCDYACELDDGSMCPVRFERKSIGDLYGTLTHDHDRFKAEMRRAEKMKIGIVMIVEASFCDVAKGYEYSSVDGRAIIRSCFTLHIRYPNVIIYPVVFTNSRSESAAYIKSYYEGWNRNLERKEKGNKRKD
jgi:ERCC4-type nuclease